MLYHFSSLRDTSDYQPPSAPQSGGSFRVLALEDETDSAEALLLSLRQWGYDARVCTSGSEALALAPAFRPNVVLLDIRLPDMDGWKVARKLRECGVNATMIAVTALGEGDDYYRSNKVGIEFHLVKPDFKPHLKQLLERMKRDRA
jgi:CheY-like chemotaxis protein